jgi:hypothetical protein
VSEKIDPTAATIGVPFFGLIHVRGRRDQPTLLVVVWRRIVADAEPDFHNLGDISQNEAEGPITGEVPPAASS